ncbi:MAG: conjugal transfer protein TrbL [Acidimicrobiaceae bacterium]|nr:conjugal transfer protein TrbL [Acidimicrobiaceae bacterium]
MAGVPILGFSLFGLGASAFKAAADLFLGEVTKWVASGAASLLKALGSVLTSTTTPDLAKGFPSEFSVMSVIGAAVALPLLVLAVIRAIIHQDVTEVLRAAFLRLPAAILLSAAAVELVSLGLQASDEMSSALLAAAGHPVEGFVGALVADVTGIGALTSGVGGVAIGGFAATLLALVAAIVSFLLWLELVVRSAAVAVATLFLPLALAGLVWPATAHWAKRLAETLAALVLSKVVIAGTLALAGVTMTSGGGLSAFVEGVALIVLATVAPFALLRLVPMIESGAVAHLDGLTHRARHAAVQAGSFASGVVDRAGANGGSGSGSGGLLTGGGGGAGGGGAGGGPSVTDGDFLAGTRVDTPEVVADAKRIEGSMAPPRQAS